MDKRVKSLIWIVLLSGLTILNAGHKETEKLLVEAKKEAGEMTAKQLKKLVDDGEVIVLDIREREQRAEGQIYADDMYEITRGNLEFKVLNLIKDKGAVIVTYCRGGSRGALAAQTLKRLGYKNATNLKGGLKGWAKEGYPIETGLGVTKLSNEE
jgi:rhodanese-related sulfurtransferase